MNEDNVLIGCLGLKLLLVVYLIVAWIINLIQFFKLDFQEPWREEIIKGIGVVVAPLAGITVWF